MNRPFQYKALISEFINGRQNLSVKTISSSFLPDHDVLIRVHYSSLNYKDILSAKGDRAVTNSYPQTPGIDASGVVVKSGHSGFSAGDQVIVTSYDLGMNTPGGFGEYISVPADWIVPLPPGLTLRESMIIGTAGFTAARGFLGIHQYKYITKESKILVSGATGGVGSFACALFSDAGYSLEAATGRSDAHSFLNRIAPKCTLIQREEVTCVDQNPLLTSRWNGALDTVGGHFLDAILRQLSHNGVAACCGNILGGELHTSIYPFILRGVRLTGIDSGICQMKDRLRIWEELSEKRKPACLEDLVYEITLDELPDVIENYESQKQMGKALVFLN